MINLKIISIQSNALVLDFTTMTGDKKENEDSKEEAGIKVNNQRLNTPKLKKMALINDGSQALKEEIQESYLRVKAAKHGMRLKDLVPSHGIQFYLPNKLMYIKPKDYQKQQIQPSSTKNRDVEEKESNTFLTSLNHSQIVKNSTMAQAKESVEKFSNNNLNKSVNLSISKGHQKSKSFNISTNNLPATTKNSSTMNQGQYSVFAKAGRSISRKDEDREANKKSKLNIGSSPEIPTRLNAISFKYSRDMHIPVVEQRRKIRLVSLIDSKPINHYITLLTLKEFSKREQEMSGVAGSIPTTSGLKEKEHQKNQDVAKILREDLNERYEERIGRRYAAYKAEQEKLLSEKLGLNADLQGKSNILDKRRDTSSPANSAESRDHSKGRRISKRPKIQGKSDIENTSVTNKSKDLQLEEKIKSYMVSDTHKEMDEKFK